MLAVGLAVGLVEDGARRAVYGLAAHHVLARAEERHVDHVDGAHARRGGDERDRLLQLADGGVVDPARGEGGRWRDGERGCSASSRVRRGGGSSEGNRERWRGGEKGK